MRPPSAHRGFSLIEAIIAVVILSVAMPAMLVAVTDAQKKRAGPVQDSKACWLAAEKLEDVIADRHSSTRGYSFVVNGNYPAEASIAGFPGYSRNVSIAETDATLGTPGAGYKTVTVTVVYTGATGASRSFSLASVVTDYTP
jgi:prepilin-type N-terminal cleavage/methylation domain-containing protein